MAAEKHPLSIRFVGKKFDTHSVPIYELGEVLLALQRMINRAYLLSLSTKGELQGEVQYVQRSIHAKSVREQLSLQLAGREAGSDVYNMIWFTDRVGASVVKELFSQVSSATNAYVKRNVYKGSLKNPTYVNPGASALYGEIQALANRINSIGDIEKIEIMMQGEKFPIIIDKNIKTYAKKLQKLEYLGKNVIIGGRITTIHILLKNAVDVFLPDRNRRVRVYVGKGLFIKLMKALNKDPNPYFLFKGRPRLKIGSLESDFKEFNARKIKVTYSTVKIMGGGLPGKRTTKANDPTEKEAKTGNRKTGRKPSGKKKSHGSRILN